MRGEQSRGRGEVGTGIVVHLLNAWKRFKYSGERN